MLADSVDPQIVRRLDVGQRRAIICRNLEKGIRSDRAKLDNALGPFLSLPFLPFSLSNVQFCLACVEMLLHLIWRHVSYYSSSQSGAGASAPAFDRQRPFGAGTTINRSHSPASLALSQSHLKTSTLRFLAIPDAQAFKMDVSALLSRAVQKVGSIELVRSYLSLGLVRYSRSS